MTRSATTAATTTATVTTTVAADRPPGLRRLTAVVLASAIVALTAAGPAWADHRTEAPPPSSVPETSVPDTSAPDTSTPVTTTPDTITTTVPPSPSAPSEVGAQTIEITSVKVAVAETGANTADAPAPDPTSPPAASAGATTVEAGTATAIGSDDRTTIDQQASVTLDPTSTAEVIQIAIVFNIGGAIANSGANTIGTGATSGGTGGEITTGSATAVGNDSDVAVVQGASGSAGAGGTDTVAQQTMTMQIGIATSSTGANTIVATLGTSAGGAVTTGDASATGNLSSTDIAQLATLLGTDGADLTVEQRATVVNLGLALADTGTNAIGSAAIDTAIAAAMTSGDQSAFEALLSLLLPSVLSSGGSGGAAAGAGSITTGDASAIGNRSTTRIDQIGLGTSAGGAVRIGQDVIVVNAGIGAALTGGNSIGAPAAVLDADSALVIQQLAGFLAQLIADVETWAAGGEIELGSGRLTTSLGPLSIDLDRTLSAATSTGDATTLRQLSAVINLAFALATTGANVTTAAPGGATAGAPAGAVVIVTGNADASNSGTITVCQRDDLEIACPGDAILVVVPPSGRAVDRDGLAPIMIAIPAAALDAPAAAAAGQQQVPDELPTTGAADVDRTVAWATVTVLAGAFLLLCSRRRQPL